MGKAIVGVMVCMLLIACSEKEVVKYTVVSGTITHGASLNPVLRKMDQSFSVPMHLGAAGSFRDSLQMETSGYYYFEDGKNYIPLYVNPGDRIQLSYDAADFKNSLKISGDVAAYANYLEAKKAREKALFDSEGGRWKAYQLEEADFLAF
ncbi:MAG: hypothetical protein AAGA86_10265, partial [Bacteroidota bacterium]